MKQNRQMLSEPQEKLLMRAHDGECGVFGRYAARRLLKRSDAARRFAGALKDLTGSVREISDSEPVNLDGLWERVETRIEQEERAALFLGKRENAARPAQSFAGAWQWGFGAAAAAACASFLMVQQPSPQPGQVAGTGGIVPQVRLSSQSDGADMPRILGGPDAVEVDWVRSDGQVRFIPDSRQRSALIWVKKRSPSTRVNRPSTLLRTSPALTLSAPSHASDPAIVVDRPLPRSIPAVNR